MQPFLFKTKDYNNMSMGMKVIAGILKLSKRDNTKLKLRRITLSFLHIANQMKNSQCIIGLSKLCCLHGSSSHSSFIGDKSNIKKE